VQEAIQVPRDGPVLTRTCDLIHSMHEIAFFS
jgi:hypothetical protein